MATARTIDNAGQCDVCHAAAGTECRGEDLRPMGSAVHANGNRYEDDGPKRVKVKPGRGFKHMTMTREYLAGLLDRYPQDWATLIPDATSLDDAKRMVAEGPIAHPVVNDRANCPDFNYETGECPGHQRPAPTVEAVGGTLAVGDTVTFEDYDDDGKRCVSTGTFQGLYDPPDYSSRGFRVRRDRDGANLAMGILTHNGEEHRR